MSWGDIAVLIMFMTIIYFAGGGSIPRAAARKQRPIEEKYGECLTRIAVDPPTPGWPYACVEYRYFCSCGTELTEGPWGGAAINAVCKTCRINYGNLPGCFVP